MNHFHSRRGFLTRAAAMGTAFGLSRLAFAQGAFPDKSKTMRGVVPLAAGSTVDVLARIYAREMSETLGPTFIIDNRPGGEFLIGLQAVKSAPADGYTVLFSSISSQVVNPHLFKQLPYDALKDFIPLGGTMKTPLVMITGPLFPLKTVKEVVAAAKAESRKVYLRQRLSDDASGRRDVRVDDRHQARERAVQELRRHDPGHAGQSDRLLLRRSRSPVALSSERDARSRRLCESAVVAVPRGSNDGRRRRSARDRGLSLGLRCRRHAASCALQCCAMR